MPRSLLPVVAAADNFPYSPSSSSGSPVLETYIPFHLTSADYANDLPPVGQLRPEVYDAIASEASRSTSNASGSSSDTPFRLLDHTGRRDESSQEKEAICFADWVVEQGKMGEVMNDLASTWRKEGKFPGPLAGWRNEHYTIFAHPQSSILSSRSEMGPLGNGAFTIERAACALFGLRTVGVHMTAYEGEGKDMKIWVPRRSATKPTWPSKLDNSVAGGIPAGMAPMESMIKECDEEASLPEDFVKRYIKQTGAVTYFYITEDGWLQPELEYTYDLQLPPASDPAYLRPKPHDDEVESFALLALPEVLDALHSGEFKPNCGLILVDFLVRHGLVTPEEEPAFFEIIWRTKRDLDQSMKDLSSWAISA